MKWVCYHRSESQFRQLRKSPKKNGFLGFNGIRTRGLCVSAAELYQPELWRPIHWRPANLLSSSTRERNETQNEMTWTAGIQMKWVCDHCSESQFKQLRKSPKKRISGLQRDSNPWPFCWAYFRGRLFLEGLIIGRNFAFQNGLDLTIKTASTNSSWAYIREGLLSEGHLRLKFGRVIFGRAYYWNFTVCDWTETISYCRLLLRMTRM